MNTFRARTVLLAFIAAAASCDTPVSLEEHPEAGGVVILDASTGAVIAQAIGNADFAAPLDLAAGETLEVEVKFLDADQPDDLALAFLPDADEGESLRVIIADPGVVAYDAQGDRGDLHALTAGQTTVTFELRHGDHAEWTSKPLTVNVN